MSMSEDLSSESSSTIDAKNNNQNDSSEGSFFQKNENTSTSRNEATEDNTSEGVTKEADVHNKNQKEREFKTHLWKWTKSYSCCVYRYPYIPIIFTLVICIILYSWLFAVYGITMSANTNYYRWSGDEISDRWDSYVGAKDKTYANLLDYIGMKITMPRQSQMTQMGCIIYERQGKNVLELNSVREMWKMEEEMHATPGWEDHCYKVPINLLPEALRPTILGLVENLFGSKLSTIEENSFCVAFKSMFTDIKTYMRKNLNFTDPQPEDLTEKIFWNFLDQPEKADVIAGTYLGRDYNNITHTTERMRSMIPFGLPILEYENKWDHYDEQNNLLGKWQIDFIKPLKKMQKEKPYDTVPYCALPFALNYEISDLILEQIWWLVGSFAFLFVFSIVVMKTFFLSIFGVIGVFLPIPCAVCLLEGVFTIHHLDVIDVIGLFLLCGIGADGLYIIFELFKQARTIYPDHEHRIAYAMQKGLLGLSTSLVTSAVSFLALCTSGVRIMRFFGIFCFLMLLFTLLFTFTWYIGFLAIWARHFEGKGWCGQCRAKKNRKRNDTSNQNDADIEDSYYENQLDAVEELEASSKNTKVHKEYPHKGVLDFLKHGPTFNVSASGLKIEKFNLYERFFHNYLSSIVYFYRLPIVVVMLVLAVVFGYFCFQMGTKSELQFLNDMHPLQRAYTLALNGFRSALNDFSFVYVWGLEEQPNVPLADTFTVTKYGYPSFKHIDFSKPENQAFLSEAWELLSSHKELIDQTMTEQFGCSGMEEMKKLANMVGSDVNPLFDTLHDFIKLYLNMDVSIQLPGQFPMPQSMYYSNQILWQLYLSLMGIDEPDSYVPGTLKINTIGFNPSNYSLKYIGMKQNIIIPEDISKENMRRLYNNCTLVAKEIEKLARKKAPDMVGGFMTGAQWLAMVTEEKLPEQVILDVGYSFIFAFVVLFLSTLSITNSIFVIYSMVSVTMLIMGILYFTNWKIGTNEAIMISIAAGFCADFIVQPIIAQSHDNTKRTRFGRLQSSLTEFCTPVSYSCITTLVAACFLYPCDIMLFPPFATFLLGSGVFGIFYGFIVLPALVALLGPKHGDSLLRICGKKEDYVD